MTREDDGDGLGLDGSGLLELVFPSDDTKLVVSWGYDLIFEAPREDNERGAYYEEE